MRFLSCLWPEFDLWHFLPVLLEWQWKQRQRGSSSSSSSAAAMAAVGRDKESHKNGGTFSGKAIS
jgi:hypothetical protein